MGIIKKILLVEDDALVAGIYRQKLTDSDFDVFVAEDGVVAVRVLPQLKPDLVVLDLLIPRLTGLDVLKFLREHSELKSVRVVVISNAFLPKLWEQVAALGVDEMMIKSAVTPQHLITIIQQTLKKRPGARPPTPTSANAPHSAPGKTAPKVESTAARKPEPKSVHGRENAPEFRERIRQEFFTQIPAICQKIQQACKEFLETTGLPAQMQRVEDLRRKVGFLTHMTSMAGCHDIAQLSGAFEALLFELPLKPSALNESARHTIAATVALLTDCLAQAEQAGEQILSPTTVLVVDDDAVSSRALVVTLNRANVKSNCVPDPLKALELLRDNVYDVVLLDINLPGMSGIALCERMRELHLHRKTPVIFVTGYAEYEPMARSILNAGDDLISKPIMPIELAVKVIAHMLRGRMAKREPEP